MGFRIAQAVAAFVASTLLLFGCDTPVISLADPPIEITTDSGGTGREAQDGDVVTIDYTIKLPDGREVLRASSYRFVLGQGAVIQGVDEAVVGMKAGGRRVFQCPPHRHWGRQGYADGKIPPNTTLTIDVRLRSIQ